MILQKIELCPFAGFQHRLVEFNRGLNVVEGENEAGKSTLVNAIKAVLFENTTQGKRALTEFSEKYFPRGKSDHAKVILTFACDGNTYTLTKIWGAGGSAHLISSDGSTWNDDQSVQVQQQHRKQPLGQ
jgi:DNA repair exonuclease SbcCD ATPase subunit